MCKKSVLIPSQAITEIHSLRMVGGREILGVDVAKLDNCNRIAMCTCDGVFQVLDIVITDREVQVNSLFVAKLDNNRVGRSIAFSDNHALELYIFSAQDGTL